MTIVTQIFTNGKILNYKPDTNISIDTFIFNKTNVVDQLNIFNFAQYNPNDYIVKIDITNSNTIPPEIFNSNYISVKNNVNVYTTNNNLLNVFNNSGIAYIKNRLLLDDKKICNFIINKNLISDKNLNIKNTDRFFVFNHDMNIKNYNDLSLIINQDFIVTNNIITKKDIYINNELNVENIYYNNLNINDTLKISNNFNSSANLDITTCNLGERLNTNNMIVNDSIIIRNNELFLPKISIYNNINGSIRLNNQTNNIEAYIKNNWNVLNTLQNIENTSSIIHQEHFKKHIGTNIDFIQNHNTTMSINNNNKIIYINHKNVNMNNIYVANNLNVHNKYNITNNINIIGSIFINNDLLLNNNLLVINSNKNSSINGSLRFNNITNCYEIYINKWQPLQKITNNNNTSNIELYPKNIELYSKNDYNSILFNLNNSIVLNINKNNCLFNRDIYVEQNVNLYDNLKINNNLNTINLNINTNNIYENNGELYNKFGKLGYDNMSVSDNIDLDVTKYIFYSSNITTIEKHCNTVDPIVLNKFAIINSSIFINSYKIYNKIYITKFILYFNQKITSNITIYINSSFYNCTVEDSNSVTQNLNLELYKDTNLKVKIKNNSNINNLYAIIYLYGTYKNVNGILLKNYSSTIIDTNNDFTDYNRVIQGNTIIKNNLNILSNYNTIIPHLQSNTIGIGTNNTITDFIVKHKNNTILIHTDNKIGINTTTLNAKLNIYANNITIDKNFNCLKTLIVSQNINNIINLNIKNTLIENNLIKNNIINYNIDKSITFLNNITNNYNLNVRNNINVSNIAILPNLSNCSNIVFNDNILKYNINSILYNTNYFPGFNNNNIYLEENVNVNFKYNNRNLLNITETTISTNNDNLNESNIFSISNNFNISTNSININTYNFIVNDINILDKLNSIESYCYCPNNLGITTTTSTTANSFNIAYNRPRFYYNLNNSITHQSKSIDYIGFQFCLGNTNNHYHPNWNTNSLIYYKNNIVFEKDTYKYNKDLNIGIITSTDYLTSNLVFEFNNDSITYNNMISDDKTQLIYNNNTVPIFERNLELNKSITLRAFPVYKTYDTYEKVLYYSEPISFTKT